jgi:hypothetical protein
LTGDAGNTNGGTGAAAMTATGGVPGAAGAAGAAQNNSLTGVCSDTDVPASPSDYRIDYSTTLQYATKGTATGDNGTFDDHCDADGMLIESMCAQTFGCSAPPGGDCAPHNRPTGQVTNQKVDCKGWCMDGACRVPCPKLNDQLMISLHTDVQLWELSAKGGPSYLCARDRSCPVPPPNTSMLTVTRQPGGSMPTESCLLPFGNDNTFQLSDGCNYFACMAEPKTGP